MFEQVERKCTLDAVSPKFYNILKKKFNGVTELTGVLSRLTVTTDYIPTAFINYVEDLDKIRNTNWRAILPELALALD